MTVARRLARAKLNLFLHVLGRWPDGYHELDSLIVFTDLADRVEARSSPTLTLSRSGPFARRLAARLGEVEAIFAPGVETPPPPDLRERLRSLGYLDP